MNTSSFLKHILSTSGYHIPIEANFVVGVIGINRLRANLEVYAEELSDNNLFVDNSITISDDDIYFANSVTIPGETVGTDRVGFSKVNTLYGGLLSGPLITGRKDTENFSISFLETNKSFIDHVLRPWSVAVSQYGLFARDPRDSQNFKTTVTIDFLDKGVEGSDAEIRKKILFNNAAPVSVEGFSASYGEVKYRTVKTTWTYSTYKVSKGNAI